MKENSSVVRECGLDNLSAVVLDVRPVIHLPAFIVDVFDIPEPVPSLLSILCVCFITSVSCESGADVEEATVRDSWSG